MQTVKVKCHYCETEFDKPKEQVVQHERNNLSHFYCNSKCMAKQKSKDFVDAFEETGLIKCGMCKNEKHYSNFSKNKNRTIGYGARCKDCSKKASKESYINHKTEYDEKYKITHQKNRTIKLNFIKKYIEDNNCFKCGANDLKTVSFVYKMNLKKEIDIYKEVNYSADLFKLKNEINKCNMICHNCVEDKTNVKYKTISLSDKSKIRIQK